MKIEAAILCDNCQVANGKLFILGGGWNMFRAANFPVNIFIGLAIDVSFARTEAGVKFPLTVTIQDDTGIPIIPTMNGQIEIGAPTEETPKGMLSKLPLALNTGLMLPRPGQYTISINAGSSKAVIGFNAIFIGNKVGLTTTTAGEQGN